jgi:DNA-binding transcriptional LysR family regulator
MLDNHRLAVFVEVARRRSFSAAGHAMSYTQSAVSHHIARLELELGVRLLERGPRSCELTPAGETLFRHAERILAMVRDAETDVEAAAGKSPRRVRLGSFQTAAATIVAESIAAARRADPTLELSLTEGEPQATLERLRAGEIDLGVVFDDPARPLRAADVTFHDLLLDDMRIALPDDHPAAKSSHVELIALEGEDWIEGAGAETPVTLILLDACERVGFEPRVAFNSGDYSVVLRLVAAGLGVALVPSLASYSIPSGVTVREIAGEPLRRRIRAAASDRPQSPGAEAMLRQLQAAAGRARAAR